MNFLDTAAFAFAAALPVVIVFYLLKRKRVVKLVSSTLLWQRFLAETQANAPFQRLRKNWLLLLQLLLLAIAVLALARPYFAARAKTAQLRVVILDASASMQATDESPSRFEKARAEAAGWVDSLASGDQMVLLEASANTLVRQPASADKAALRRALQESVCSDGPTRLVPALRIAESLVRDQPGAEIHLFSDGAVPELAEFENKALPLVYHKVGRNGDNTGITALDARANPDDPRQRAIYTAVVNYSSNSVSRTLELLLDNKPVDARPLRIGPGETAPQVFLASQSRDGVFTVRLDGRDALAADDSASIVSLLPKPVRVLLVSRENRLLEKALRAVPNVQLSVATGLADAAPGFDFIVLNNITTTAWPRCNVLAFRAYNPQWFEEVSRLEAPDTSIVDWKATHPLLRYAGFDNVQIAESLATKAPSWAVPLVDAPRSALIVAGELGSQRIVWVGFDSLQSNWPLRVSFPIFIANAVEWLNPANTRGGELLVRSGEALRLRLTQTATSAEITYPSGATRPVSPEPGGNGIVFGDTARRGIYHVRAGTNDLPFCVNLLDGAESNIQPKDDLRLGKYEKVSATRVQRTNMELWRTITALALLLLLAEWWYYHRRTV